MLGFTLACMRTAWWHPSLAERLPIELARNSKRGRCFARAWGAVEQQVWQLQGAQHATDDHDLKLNTGI